MLHQEHRKHTKMLGKDANGISHLPIKKLQSGSYKRNNGTHGKASVFSD